MTNTVGIHDLACATAHNVLDLAQMAEHYGVDVDKYYVGVGQSRMSVLGQDEDVVTMAAEAASRVLDRHDRDRIRTVLFATESGVDQSKSAGVYVHELLGLPTTCRAVELKQACYSGTAALQFALGIVARDPDEQVLVIASDSARYEIGSSGETTQGAGAVAMLITADPALVAIESANGVFTSEIHDFWRPNESSTALVDSKRSLLAYLTSLEGAWNDYRVRGGANFDDIARFCYHQPFTKMAIKAHSRLARIVGREVDADARLAELGTSLEYNRVVGNSYTASLYLGLLSLLDSDEDLSDRRIGFFSYGSGSVAEFFSGIVQQGYRDGLRAQQNRSVLAERTPIDYAAYARLHRRIDEVAGTDYLTEEQTPGPYRFAGVRDRIRRYEATVPA